MGMIAVTVVLADERVQHVSELTARVKMKTLKNKGFIFRRKLLFEVEREARRVAVEH
ncbi:hypothetical protein FC15_GL000709 [Lapidilactobacillus concavus DSM 17758]|jgi:hypothetical protein|uniref:Uncharacterized protein n=1 Tax=Lapidilactobacillus concavus DSM 17758 TaxID=1423735 RepID=A0A0R1VY99_9LACO|nr:hypothetical protein [Lapidilactobacillus concavus]KRM08035.1 hypothetical protein FC15_GL000709 [Lapidilactobacillus concavus DSM 17758]